MQNRTLRGFALIEVVIVVAVLLALVLGASLYISNSKQTMVDIQTSSACSGFAQSVASSVQGGTNALDVRNYLPTRYNSVTPYSVADAQDPLCNTSSPNRSALCDTQPLISLTPDFFVRFDQNSRRYRVMTSLNVRGTSTWAINLYNSCGPSGQNCPFGGDISSGITLQRTAFDQFRSILPDQNVTIPPEIQQINFSITARPAAPSTIDLNWSGVLTFNVSATTQDGQTCLVPPVMVNIGRDAEAPHLAGIYLATLRTAPTPLPAGLLLARNPNPNYPRTSAYSNAQDPTSDSANMDNYVPSGGIPLIDFQLNPNANSCTCSPSEYLRWGRQCPHWTRTVYLEAQSNEAGTLMLCQRNRVPSGNPDATGADIGRNDRYRYCAMGLSNLTDQANDPCLVQLPLAPGTQRLCSTATYNTPSRVVLVWNNLPDGEYQALFKPVDTSGNASATPYPVSFRVREPNPPWNLCPDPLTLCPGQSTVTVSDPNCGYTFSCPGTRPECPPTANYCPDGSPCWATGTCGGGHTTRPTPACNPTTAPACPSGTRAGVGCDTSPYVACTDQVFTDDCGNACPPRPRVPPTPPPASVLASLCPDQSINVCGTIYPGTRTTGCNGGGCCPPPDQLCSGQTFIKDCDGVTACPGTRGMVCPPTTDYCGTTTFTCGTSSVTCSGGTNCTTGGGPPGPPGINCDASNYAYYKPNGDLTLVGQPCTGCPAPSDVWNLRSVTGGVIVDPTRNQPGNHIMDRGNTIGQPVKYLCALCAPDGHAVTSAHGEYTVPGSYPSCSPFNLANQTSVHWGPGAAYTPWGEPLRPTGYIPPTWQGDYGALGNKLQSVTSRGMGIGGFHYWMFENGYFTYDPSVACCSGTFFKRATQGTSTNECQFEFAHQLVCGSGQCQPSCPPPEMYCSTDRIGDGCGGCCPAGTNSGAKMTCLGNLAPSCPAPTPAPVPAGGPIASPNPGQPGIPPPSGPTSTIPPQVTTGPGCTPQCRASITDNYCVGEPAADTCGNMTCTGTRNCSCTPNCPATVTNAACSGSPTGVSDGCGGQCLGTMNCGACTCNPAQTNNYCIGSPAHDSCGRWPWQGGSCTGTRPTGCESGVSVCGGVCPTPTPTPSCQNECSDNWDCGSGTCDPYTNCSTPNFVCQRGANGCNQCVYQGMCQSCSPSYY